MKIIPTTVILFLLLGCTTKNREFEQNKVKILFLHHSTGRGVWLGGRNKIAYKLTNKGAVEKMIEAHNRKSGTNYVVKEQDFPKRKSYGWRNYPYDYYNIWVKNAGDEPYMYEPTLEILTLQYDVIVFKHCFPISHMKPDTVPADINSEMKMLGNYKLQYDALKEKMHSYPNTKFIVWTGAALVQDKTNEEEAALAKEFSGWVTNEWNEEGDNIFIWDFRMLETGGGLYLNQEYATSTSDSHPNKQFNKKAAKLFVDCLLDVIENN